MATSKYREADDKGRDIFIDYCKRQNWCTFKKASKDDYAHWDVSYLSGDTMVIGEIKVREYESTDYNGWFLEVFKYNELKHLQSKMKEKNKDVQIHYINIYTNQEIIIWDLDKTLLNKNTLNLPKTTMEDNGEKIKQIYTVYKAEAVVNEPINKVHKIDNNVESDDDLPF